MNAAAKLAVILAVPILLAAMFAVSVMGYVLYEGPRMRTQSNVRAYQVEVPPMPAGAVPAGTPDAAPNGKAPTAEAAAGTTNPVPASEESVARGKVYYHYCVFCHGDTGDGNGPVGQSYVPKPADLRTPKIVGYSDGQMLRAMLVGVGHEPVLEKVVPDEHRWSLVNYLRTLGAPPKK
jgi:mono/diheme cytochrome c family protein